MYICTTVVKIKTTARKKRLGETGLDSKKFKKKVIYTMYIYVLCIFVLWLQKLKQQQGLDSKKFKKKLFILCIFVLRSLQKLKQQLGKKGWVGGNGARTHDPLVARPHCYHYATARVLDQKGETTEKNTHRNWP